MNIIYLLSDSFDYSKLVCDDAGPGYAHAMGWSCLHLSEMYTAPPNTVFVLDNRIPQHELELVEDIITQYKSAVFFLKVVDPGLYNTQHYYYQFVSKTSALKNTRLLSVYHATGITLQLKAQFKNRFVHLPYPYLQQKEVGIESRKHKIIITGSINQTYYPYRTAIWRKVTRSFTRLLFFHILKHPGYIDLQSGETHIHKFVKDNYILYLSRYKFMLLCPSIFGIELLKFNECAYAGCFPVGMAPNSYPDHIKALFLQLRPQALVKDTLKIIFGKHKEDDIIKLRLFLQSTRNPQILNKIFIESIENTLHTS